MDIHKRGSECQICEYHEWFLVPQTLGSFRRSAIGGCLRCKLLSESASLFRDRWLHLDERADKLVKLGVSKYFTRLTWPSSPKHSGDEEELDIEVTTEHDCWILDSDFTTFQVIASSSTAPECLDFIRSRIASCDQKHTECEKKSGSRLVWPRRLLRIQNSGEALKVLLMETSGTSENYVALSHCWGDPKNATGKVPKTEKNDLDVYKSTGIPISTLTKTFQEAIDITQKLGVEYIWIDSLCIVQNDREDWRIESQKMGDIYGNAYLVIAATHAENGAYGLHRERISRRFEVVTPTGQTIKAQVFEKAHHDVWKKGEQFGYAAELPLFSRAWAFQERLLARRVVHYTPTELVWECSTCIDCECGDLRNPNTAWPEFGIGKNMKTRYGEVVTDSNIARLEFWHVICAQYSARKLTYPTDRLPALSSVAKRIDMPDVLGRYLAGIWECNLPKGLFWWSEFTNSALHPPAIKTHWRDKTHQIPTWSWLSIEGRVSTWGMIEACLIVVRVVVISYTVSSNDDYGTCEEGIITLEGVGVPIEVVDAKRSGGPSDKEVRLIGEEHSVDFYTDENPFEYSEQDSKTGELLAFLFGYTNMHSQAMILKQVPGTNNRYERLGIANPCPHGWFAGQTTREIELV